jgi:ribonuclease Z
VSFSLTILGSSSALPTSKRFTSAHLLNVDERLYLIDCGEGVQMQLRRFKIRFGKINHIFISHVHGDHILGLFGLLSSFNLLGRKEPLHIFSHHDLQKIISPNLQWLLGECQFPIVYHPVKPSGSELIFEDDKLTVHSIPLKHRIPTVGFLFREKSRMRNIKKEAIEKYELNFGEIVKIKDGADLRTKEGLVVSNNELTDPSFRQRSYAYCSDTAYYESIIPIISGVDLLYHEATFLHKELKRAKDNFHSTALQAATIAEKAKVKKLLIGHYSARYKDVTPLLDEAKNIFPDTEAVEDGDIYNVELSK